MHNLDSFRTKASQWNLHSIGSLRREKNILLNHLQGVQNVMQLGRDHARLHKLENKVQVTISKVMYQDELIWFQREKINWTLDGDMNTKFYHTRDVQCRRSKVINMLKDNDNNWIEDEDNIKALFHDHLKKIFTTNINING